MKILSSNIKTSYTIKKSKFLCFGYIVKSKEEVKDILNILKKEYSDATHVCYAYILDDKTYYFYDGGEPSGTAGKPIYRAIQSLQLNYTLVVVVRYFGGIKFGTGPLQSTFNKVTKDTLSSKTFIKAQMVDIIKIHCDFNKLKSIEQKIHHFIYLKKYDNDGAILLLIDNEQTKSLIVKLKIKPLETLKHQLIIVN